MSGDYSRDRFSPSKDFLALLQQQGRVHCDADGNERVKIVDRRFRAQTADTIGRCTVPSETPDGFRITLAERTLTIGRGRMYVDGLLAENHGKGAPQFDPMLAEEFGPEALGYTEQPYFHDAATTPRLPDGVGPHLVYIVAWQRELTAIEHPDLIEPAIGQDTVTALQTAWQVRILENAGANATCTASIPEWDALIRPSEGRLSTSVVEAPADEDPCIIAGGGGGYSGLENQLYRVEIHKAGAIGTATFKWSRDNASVAAGVLEIADRLLTVTRIGRDSVLRFRPGDWVEITDDVREFDARPGELRRVTNVDDATRMIEIDSPLPAAEFPADADGTLQAGRHTRIRRWDQQGEGLADTNGEILVPAAGTAVDLEKGVRVSFETLTREGQFKSGDYWTFAARVADASLEKLVKAPPRGIHRHYGRLAIVTFPDQATDCRVIWPPPRQAPVPDRDRGIPIRRVVLAATQDELPNDREVPAPMLARGIQILLGDVLDERSLIKRPTCYVTLDLPYPLNAADQQLWPNGIPGIGYQSIHLEAKVQLVQGQTILWTPSDMTANWLNGQLFPELLRRRFRDPLLVRLRLMGNFIWGRAADGGVSLPVFVDGDAFADPRSGQIDFPTGDGRRGGNFEMWFWLIPG